VKRARVLLATVGLLAVLRPGPAAGAGQQLSERWRRWVDEEVYPLLSAGQREAFLALRSDGEREEFAARLWREMGERSGLGDAFRARYEARLEEVRAKLGDTVGDRARAVLLQGWPDERIAVECPALFVPLEFWRWRELPGLGRHVTVLFYKRSGDAPFRLWDPTQGREVLRVPGSQPAHPLTLADAGALGTCTEARTALTLLAVTEVWSGDARVLGAMARAPGAAAAEGTLQVPPGARALPFDLDREVVGRRGGKLRVRFSLSVPRGLLATSTVGGAEVVTLQVHGEVTREGAVIDTFQYAFTFPAGEETLPMAIERELRPGAYHLHIEVEDAASKRAGEREEDFMLEVPASLAARGSPATRAGRGGAPPHLISLAGPALEGVSGQQHFTALVAPQVASVQFLLDGRPVLKRNRPPFEADLDLGPFPRLAEVTAVAYGPGGDELERADLELNVGRERFLVRLQPVGPSGRQDGRLRVAVTVHVPAGAILDRVELYREDVLLATLRRAPFEAWVPAPDVAAAGYLRALAILDDGAQAEDVEFVDAPRFVSAVQVSAVELPVLVLGRGGKPVEGLTAGDFHIREDGVPQRLSHFALQRDVPIRVGLVIDQSGSMERTLPEVQRVALGFLRNLLRPSDRAFVVSFSDQPFLLEGFTADLGALERALLALHADRETALYDAVVFSLFQFSGVRGRKALVVLSDGDDNVSHLDSGRTLDYAARMGVTIYTVGIDLPLTELRARSLLNRLAERTGGEAFFLARDASLQAVYDKISEELRTQYLLVYTSGSDDTSGRFRAVEVTVDRPGAEVRTIPGYYPGS
jgi:Ca-activated chloride channel family protein